MSFLDLAKNRYTTKKYDKTKKLSDEQISQLREILRLSPSSIDSQPWNFIFVKNEELKKKLAMASYFNQHKVEDASYIVVFNVIDNIQKFEEQINASVPQSSIDYYKQKIKNLSEEDIKKWLQSQVYISLGFFLPACESLGIDSTAMEGIQTIEYGKILGLKDYKTLFAVAIGYRNKDDENQLSITPKERLPLDKVTEIR